MGISAPSWNKALLLQCLDEYLFLQSVSLVDTLTLLLGCCVNVRIFLADRKRQWWTGFQSVNIGWVDIASMGTIAGIIILSSRCTRTSRQWLRSQISRLSHLATLSGQLSVRNLVAIFCWSIILSCVRRFVSFRRHFLHSVYSGNWVFRLQSQRCFVIAFWASLTLCCRQLGTTTSVSVTCLKR